MSTPSTQPPSAWVKRRPEFEPQLRKDQELAALVRKARARIVDSSTNETITAWPELPMTDEEYSQFLKLTRE